MPPRSLIVICFWRQLIIPAAEHPQVSVPRHVFFLVPLLLSHFRCRQFPRPSCPSPSPTCNLSPYLVTLYSFVFLVEHNPRNRVSSFFRLFAVCVSRILSCQSFLTSLDRRALRYNHGSRDDWLRDPIPLR